MLILALYPNLLNVSKEKTSGLLPKEEHSDFDALVDKLKSDPSLKRELLNKLLEKR